MDRSPWKCNKCPKRGENDEIRIPEYHRLHPIFPLRYVQPWKRDMVNRSHLIENARLGNIPNYEHDDCLFWSKREQKYYNVENQHRVLSKFLLPPRHILLKPPLHHPFSRYYSGLLKRLP